MQCLHPQQPSGSGSRAALRQGEVFCAQGERRGLTGTRARSPLRELPLGLRQQAPKLGAHSRSHMPTAPSEDCKKPPQAAQAGLSPAGWLPRWCPQGAAQQLRRSVAGLSPSAIATVARLLLGRWMQGPWGWGLMWCSKGGSQAPAWAPHGGSSGLHSHGTGSCF